jgi:hypothetical protein
MGRKNSFLEGFNKKASFVQKAKRLVGGAAAVGLAGYGAGKFIQKSEDPEQAKLRQLRKMKALPYQQG